MLGVRLSEELDQRLTALADETLRSKSFYVKEALAEYLDEHEDYLLALSRLEKYKKGETKGYTLEEIKSDLGLNDS